MSVALKQHPSSPLNTSTHARVVSNVMSNPSMQVEVSTCTIVAKLQKPFKRAFATLPPLLDILGRGLMVPPVALAKL